MSDPNLHEIDLHLLALDFAPSGIVAVDAEGRILLVNREIENLFGYRREELVGSPVEILIPNRFHGRHVSDRAHFTARPSTRPMGEGRDLFGRHKDGSEIPVEVGLNPVRTTAGTLVFASVVDVRVRRRAEERFQAAVESSPSGMLMVDSAGAIVLVNRETERLFGYPRVELIGKPVEMLVPLPSTPGHPGLLRSFFDAPSERVMGVGRELTGRRKDGSEVPVEIGLNPLRTEQGLFVLASIVDVSERREAERRLREGDERRRQNQKLESLGTLASGIAHDLNNVLMAVAGYTELALRDTREEGVLRDLEQVLRATERGRQLIRRILTFSRKSEPRRHAIRVDRAVEETVDLLRSTLPSTIEIRARISPDTPVVLGDETEIHQIVMNLASNAAHAMSAAGGVLALELEGALLDATEAARVPGLEAGRYARLSVSDDGVGMTEEVQRRALEPFFTTKPVGEGTGLGLSVIHGIVTTQGGALALHSTPGRGTQIDIYLRASETPGEAQAPPPPEADFGGKRVLLVDDEPTLAMLLRRRLESLGLQVTLHTESPAALEEFRARPEEFELVITDNTMPKLTGIALARELHRMRPELPILMVSGIGDAMAAEELRELGIRQVLPKPHSSAEMIAALRDILGEA